MKTTKPSSGRLLMSFTVVLSASYKSKKLQELPLFFFLKLGFWFYCWFSCCFRPQKISSSATRSIEFTKVSMVVMALVMMLLLWSVIWGVVCIFLGWWFLFLRFSIVLFLTCFVFFLILSVVLFFFWDSEKNSNYSWKCWNFYTLWLLLFMFHTKIHNFK